MGFKDEATVIIEDEQGNKVNKNNKRVIRYSDKPERVYVCELDDVPVFAIFDFGVLKIGHAKILAVTKCMASR